MSARIEPAQSPFSPEIQKALDRTMPKGVPPLVLFTTLARDPRLFGKFFAGGLLDKGNVTLRQREVVIHRVTGRCRSRYEFGVHAAFFGERVGFSDADLATLAHGGADDARWSADERALIGFADALHAGCDVDQATWDALAAHLPAEGIIEVILLCGFYRTVSYLTNALRLPEEPFGTPFPA